MCRKLIYIMTFVFALGSTAHAALYLWNGSAGDGNWDTPANWTVTDSAWTWPNEEYGGRQVNSDTIAIDILNGDAVSRGSQLGIDGAADGSTTGVLTLNNGSSLTVGDDLATSTDPGRRGQIDILGGSTLTVTGDNDIRIADDPDTWGMLNIVDSTVNIGDDLRLDQGEGYVYISGSSILNSDDGITVADANTAVSYLDISGTAVITLVDDFKIDEGIGTIIIGDDAVISFGDDCYIPDQPPGNGTLTLTGNSVFNVGDDMTIADDATTVGHVIVTGNATLNAPDELYLADEPTAFATLDVNGTATLNVGDDLDVGEDGPAVCNIGENATVTVTDTIYIPHNEQGIEARMTISGNALVTCSDLQVVNDGGNTGYLHISGNPTIITDEFIMNNDAGNPGTSEVIMDGGTVTVSDNSTINDDNNGTATFIMNGGSFHSTGYLNLSDNLDGTAHLTMNGGEMITGGDLRLGKDGGDDIGQVRIFMNGGLLQAEGLDIQITDTQIIYTGGAFLIGSANVNEAGMQQLITDGTIVADGVYSIVTVGDYTVLSPQLPTQAKLPYPADGAEGVLLGTTLSWAAGTTAATHDVYFGTTNPPAFIGNQEATTYYQPIEVGTTYYWRIDEVEADGTTVHTGDVWSFTTTTDLSTVSEIATQPSPADGAIAVASDATLSWWPGASAVSHRVFFGTTSPPTLIGRTTEFSLSPGPLEYDTTYYWRVDEVTADGTIHTGDIWSFKTALDIPITVPNLVGWWSFDEARVNMAIDWSGYGNYGTVQGDPTYVEGKIGGALKFDGDDDQIKLKDPLPIGSSSSTVAAWIKVPLAGTEGLGATERVGIVLGNGTYIPNSNWELHELGQMRLWWNNGEIDHMATTDLRDDTWHHCVWVRDKAYNANYMYIDGQLEDTIPTLGADITFNTKTTHCIGGDNRLNPPNFHGLLDEVRVYDIALSAAEIQAMVAPPEAWGPDPADGATDVSRTPTLSWLPGATAASHDVYLGDSEPLAFIGNQTETSYSPPGMLDKGKTYYWRIDEVEADGTTKHTGDVWSFTVTTAGR